MATTLERAAWMLKQTLEAAQNGLKWYRDEYPTAASPVDQEMHDAIENALAGFNDTFGCAAPRPMRPEWNWDMEAAPHDATPLLLLVDYSGSDACNNIDQEDGTDRGVTIGHNARDNTGEDRWEMAGWDWCHDCYTRGSGRPIAWMPRPAATPKAEG